MSTDPQKPEFSKKKPLNDYLKYSAMSFQMMAIILLFTFGGIKIDHYLGLKFPAFTLSLCLLSIVAAFYLFIKDFIKK